MLHRLLSALAVVIALTSFALGAASYVSRTPTPPPAPSASAVETPVQSQNYRIVDDEVEVITTSATPAVPTNIEVVETNATVTRVVDGDTVVVLQDNGEEATVRLLGVNTPETVDPRKTVECFGKEASNFTKHELTGQRIRLDPDPQADERDKYGRLLRNIVMADGTDFNALLVHDGYAYAYLSFPLDPARKREIKQLETEAKEAKRGLWGDDVCQK
jgi:micrococcal nuclease